MRKIINLVITFVVLWVAQHYFADHVQIADNKTLIIATLAIFLMNVAFGWMMGISIMLMFVGIGFLTTPLLFLTAFVLKPIELAIINAMLPGFHISGFWTFILLGFALNLFSIKAPKTADNNVNNDNKSVNQMPNK